MEIECPNDYDFATSENRVFSELETYRAPDITLQAKSKRKRKRDRMGKSGSPSHINTISEKEKEKEKENYFQKMYREANKKMYINLFVRKLKQGLVGRHKPKH